MAGTQGRTNGKGMEERYLLAHSSCRVQPVLSYYPEPPEPVALSTVY